MSEYASLAQSGCLYVPGTYYDASRGMTIQQFEDPNNVAKSCPVESGFLRDPTAFGKAIVVANFSGSDAYFVCDRASRINRNLPSVRENEKELDGIPIPNGCVSHFNVPPSCFNVSVKQKLLTENGREQYETRQGYELSTLSDKVLTFYEGSEEGVITESSANGHLSGYTYVVNSTDRPIDIKITKTSTAYPLSPDELKECRVSRTPDGGGQVVHKQVIKPGGTWHVKNQRIGWTIRALDINQVEEDNNLVNAGLGAPPMDNYVQLAQTNATNNQFAILFSDRSRNGACIMKSYRANEIKPIASDIVVTGPYNS